MRHERHDGTSASAGWRPPIVESRATRASRRQARTARSSRLPAQRHSQHTARRSGHEAGDHDRSNRPRRIEDRQDDQPEGVIDNRQQEQKRDRRMLAEDRLRHEIAERDVGGARNRPAAREFGMALQPDEPHVEERPGRTSRRRRPRRAGRPPPRMERAARRRRFDDFLGSQGEEERHPDVVHAEVNDVGEALVAVVRPCWPRRAR